MRLAGVAVHYQSFSATAPMPEAAQSLATRTDLFQKAVVFRDKAVLSGIHEGWHWAVEIGTTRHGSRGLVSAVPMRPRPSGHVRQSGTAGRFEWLPQGSVLKFSQQVDLDGRVLAQRIYSVALVPDVLRMHLHAGLARSGWLPVSGGDPGTPGMDAWHRNASRLMLMVRADPPASSLFVQYLE